MFEVYIYSKYDSNLQDILAVISKESAILRTVLSTCVRTVPSLVAVRFRLLFSELQTKWVRSRSAGRSSAATASSRPAAAQRPARLRARMRPNSPPRLCSAASFQ